MGGVAELSLVRLTMDGNNSSSANILSAEDCVNIGAGDRLMYWVPRACTSVSGLVEGVYEDG